jgi:hypothetical protein
VRDRTRQIDADRWVAQRHNELAGEQVALDAHLTERH